MRIDDTRRPPPVSRTRAASRTERPDSADFAGQVSSGGRTEAGAPAPSTPLTSLDTVLAAQAVDDPGERRRQAVRRGYDLLEQLEAIRMGLLEGTLPERALRRIETLVAEKRGRCDDPRIEDLLDQIELRAVVELAKLERAREG